MKKAYDAVTSSQMTGNFGGSVSILKMPLQGNPVQYHCESQSLRTRTALFITEKFFREGVRK